MTMRLKTAITVLAISIYAGAASLADEFHTTPNAGTATIAAAAGKPNTGSGDATTSGRTSSDSTSETPAASSGGAAAYELVRSQAFARIDRSLGIDSQALMQERLAAVAPSVGGTDPTTNSTGNTIGGAAPPEKKPPTLVGILRRIVNSDQASAILDLAVGGGKERLIAGLILGTLQSLGPAESTSPELVAETDALTSFLENDDNRRALVDALRAIEQRRAVIEQHRNAHAELMERLEAELKTEIEQRDREAAKRSELSAIDARIRDAEEVLQKLREEANAIRNR